MHCYVKSPSCDRAFAFALARPKTLLRHTTLSSSHRVTEPSRNRLQGRPLNLISASNAMILQRSPQTLENTSKTRTIYTVVLYIYGNKGAMPPGTRLPRYEALRPMARSRYGLCGGLGRCAQHSPRKVGGNGCCLGPPNPKTWGNESARRKIESFDLFARQHGRTGYRYANDGIAGILQTARVGFSA